MVARGFPSLSLVLLRRFLLPPVLVTVLCWLKFRAKVSHRAEVEWGPNLRLGRGVVIGSFTKLKSRGPLEIEDYVDIANGCFLSARAGGIRIGQDTLIGPNVSILSGNYRIGDLHQPIRLQGETSKGVRIGANVWIGASSTILDGAEIGAGCVVSANSVVTGRLPPNAVVAGNPARVVFMRRD